LKIKTVKTQTIPDFNKGTQRKIMYKNTETE